MKVFPLSKYSLLKKIGAYAAEQNVRLYAVGGCVRDWLLGIRSKDVDLAGSGDIKKIAQFIEKEYTSSVEEFPSFFTHRCFLGNGERMDIAHLRKEAYPSAASLPVTEKTRKIEEDLVRRDFSCNAMAVDISGNFGEVIDIFNGVRDIKMKKLKILHERSFRDDPTRIFRAARFCARFNWRLEKKTSALMKSAVNDGFVSLLSGERVKNELFVIFKEEKPERALNLLKKYGVAKSIGLEILSGLPKSSPEMRFAYFICKSRDAEKWIKFFGFKRSFAVSLKRVVNLLRLKRSPLVELSNFEKKLLSFLLPAKKQSAFQKVFVGGTDIKEFQINEGKKIGKIISEAAALQWKGHLGDKKEAKKWLKKKIGK